MLNVQLCNKCHVLKLLDKFPSDVRGRNRVATECIVCKRLRGSSYMKKRRKEDPEHFKQARRKHYIADIQKSRAYKARKERERVAKNRDAFNANLRAKYALDGHRQREASRRRHIKTDKTITKAQWLEILEINDNRCAYCLVQSDYLEMDHVIPLVRGGPHEIDNVVPACAACNCSKNDKLLLDIFSPHLVIEQRRTLPID